MGALAALTGHALVRLNLSEQTDMMDLLGADLPSEGGSFSWRAGLLLRAVEEGAWLLLDEMNLAPQSVLEGLNALLDHRRAVWVPELQREVTAHPSFRLFACQNPVGQGGGRKALPASFLSRFVKVHLDALEAPDLRHILARTQPLLTAPVAARLVSFLEALRASGGVAGTEPNLRDLQRWTQAIAAHGGPPQRYVAPLFGLRARTPTEAALIRRLAQEHVGSPEEEEAESGRVQLSAEAVRIGHLVLPRVAPLVPPPDLRLLPRHGPALEVLALAVSQRWPSLVVGVSGSARPLWSATWPPSWDSSSPSCTSRRDLMRPTCWAPMSRRMWAGGGLRSGSS